MPVFRQGEVLATGRDEGFEVVLVFGHRGYNFMDMAWREFSDGVEFWRDIADPFGPDSAGRPHEYEVGRWMWFFRGGLSQGMADDEFKGTIEKVFDWAAEQRLRRVITNGVNDTDLGLDTQANQASNDKRTEVLVSILSRLEDSGQFDPVHLISLNDVFVRQRGRLLESSKAVRRHRRAAGVRV